MHQLLRAVSVTLQHVIQDDLATDPRFNGSAPEGVIGPPPLKVSIDSPRTVYGLGDDAVSVWLYRVVHDAAVRNQLPVAGASSPAASPVATLHYVITPIVADDRRGAAETSQYLLGRVLDLLHARPLLSGADLQGELAGTAAQLTVVPDAMHPDAMMRFWAAAQMPYRLCAAYQVTARDVTAAER